MIGNCTCGAPTTGKWADKHSAGCPTLRDGDEFRGLLTALRAIDCELHVALIQRVPSDDALIMGHIEAAKAIASAAIVKARASA